MSEESSVNERKREDGGGGDESAQKECKHVEILLDIDYVDDYIDSCIPATLQQGGEEGRAMRGRGRGRGRGRLDDVEAEMIESDEEVEAIFINHEDVQALSPDAATSSVPISPGEKVRMWTEEILPNFESVIRKKWVHALWKQGIPWKLRQNVWPRAIGNKLNLDHDKYESLAMVVNDRSFFIPGIEIINNDLPRTKLKGKDVDEAQLRVLLCTVSALQPEVGYVQGMSYLGAIFLLFMAPAEAFVCLGNLLSCRFFPSFLRMDAEKIELRWKVFEILLGQELPDLAYHFHTIGFSSDLIITEWWLTIFSKNFPVELSCRVWDCFLLEGESFLFRAALGLCLLLRDRMVGRAMEDCHAVLMRSGESVEAEDFFRAVGDVKASSKFIREMLEA
ncbi:hypothetical protein GUITHDRAFT_100034 [Guillardia theta CCMP2712]|uniref:Rab-GAP TBC domain-containing protein n=2 Tax=Guillardia theta TaxID=55529 RepID=L1K281_GUITC|nr:hypothetical protein GUITHDRAFT_100034 [Guillardia theta CCMP2712]EKX54560.1 hypothetical protein GUITHDRAFT_100034 [Guillardia theta CCMP2712]|eukprot:XP_005841540.1 hypothetical protein GUITHDRAFT_100034 [Guillardia theta CCMP2712]